MFDDELKYHSRKDPQYCKKLKGAHDYEIDDTRITYWGLAHKDGANSIHISGDCRKPENDEGELPEGYSIKSINVWLLYKCQACGKQQHTHNNLKL